MIFPLNDVDFNVKTGAKKVVIANAKHAANIQQPEAFNGAIADFMGEVGPPGVAVAKL